MARKRRNSNSEAAKEFNSFLRRNRSVIAALVVIVLVLTGVFIWLNDFFCSASCFEVDKIEVVKPGREGSLYVQKEYFKLEYPVNIFTVDTAMLSKKIKEAHPEYQIVIITKFLPDRIVANIKDREAFAKIKAAKIIPIDFDGFVVSDAGGLDSLPLITGLESQPANPKTGTKVKSKRLSVALEILRQFYSRKEFKRYEAGTVDMTYPDKASFTAGDIIIITGSNLSDFEREFDALAQVLDDSKLDKSRLDSIDLRFTDPAVTFKPEKK